MPFWLIFSVGAGASVWAKGVWDKLWVWNGNQPQAEPAAASFPYMAVILCTLAGLVGIALLKQLKGVFK